MDYTSYDDDMIERTTLNHLGAFFALCAGCLGAWLAARGPRTGHSFSFQPRGEVLYKETFASGRSLKNWYTRIGGARNCLRVVVTPGDVWVGPFFPFNLITRVDLEHRIPQTSIRRMERQRSFFRDSILIDYSNQSGEVCRIELFLHDREAFLKAVGWEKEQGSEPGRIS